MNIVVSYLKNIVLALLGQLKTDALAFLKKFATDDLGKIAKAAAAYVEAKLDGATGAEKLAAAKAKFAEDAKAAGVDLKNLGTAELNWIVESGLQALLVESGKGIASL